MNSQRILLVIMNDVEHANDIDSRYDGRGNNQRQNDFHMAGAIQQQQMKPGDGRTLEAPIGKAHV